jgi:arabinofuranosyltransferase
MQKTEHFDAPTLPLQKSIISLVLTFFTFIITKDAWLCDDSYITFRVVDNFLHGYGLTWNVDERVQVYTHPLWMLLLVVANFFVRDIYFASLLLSLIISTLAVALFASKFAPFSLAIVGGVTLLAASKSFVDFSTSGLENPLTHLLTVLFVLVFVRPPQRHAFFWLALLTALIALTRMDLVLLFLPALISAGIPRSLRQGIRTLGTLCVAFLPFIAWELFALFYYGFLFPNTAYAKLGVGVTQGELTLRGMTYLIGSFKFDPILFLVIVGACFLVIAQREVRSLPLLLGMILYLVYVVEIGGDFMAGRFLTPIYLIAVILLVRTLPRLADVPWGSIVLCTIVITFLVPGNRWYSFVDAPMFNPPGVNDERSFYVAVTGLINFYRGTLSHNGWATEGMNVRMHHEKVVLHHNIGFTGFEAGPTVHIVDDYALADPLLARLPLRQDIPRFAGHYERAVPPGYIETLQLGRNHIQDPHLAQYYARLHDVVSGPLFSWQRLGEIWQLNTGGYDSLLHAYRPT